MWKEHAEAESEGDLFVDCVTEDDITFDTTIADSDVVETEIEPNQCQTNDAKVGLRPSLLSILNGNMKPKTPKAETSVITEKAIAGQKKVSVMELLGYQPKTQRAVQSEVITLQNTRNILSAEDIESKMYGNASIRRTTVKDLLGGRQLKAETSATPIIEIDDIVELEQDPEMEYIQTNEILESKIYRNSARSSAKDILMRHSTKQESKKSTFMVTLKLPKKSMLVTLNINNEKLQAIKKESRKKTNAFFQSMMTASKKSTPKATRFQRLKELPIPSLTRNEFHVKDCEDFKNDDLTLSMPFSKRMLRAPSLEEVVRQMQITAPEHLIRSPSESEEGPSFNVQKTSYNDILNIIQKRIPNFEQIPQLRAIYDKFISQGRRRPLNGELWVNFFRPQQSLELLISESSQRKVNSWLKNSFLRLRLQALKRPRNVLIKEKKRRQRNQLQNEFDNFIVDDYSDISYTEYTGNGSETDEEIFVPILVLKGPTGSCKSSSIYASMEEQGGYVFEVNSGQPRSRRDIWNTLKEFATTQIVQKQNMFKFDNIIATRPPDESDSGFQKGIILFEDVNILFEQDKTFWQLIQELLNISRRPIILTCNSLENIPKSILEHVEVDSILTLNQDEVDRSLASSFIWLCCFSQGFNISEDIIHEIITLTLRSDDQHLDLRSCLMECQFICQQYETLDEYEFLEIEKHCKIISTANVKSLSELAHEMNIISHGDVIQSNSYSLVHHDQTENEFLDLSILDSSNWLKQFTTGHELNIGNYLVEKDSPNSKSFILFPKPLIEVNFGMKFLSNSLRLTIFDFLSSRSKKKYRITRSATPMDYFSSDGLFSFFTGLENKNSELELFIYKSGMDAILLELLPYGRRWLYFQRKLNEIDTDNSVKAFLGYRVFNYESSALMDTFTFSWSATI